MANLKAGTLIGGNMIWNTGNMPLRVDGSKLYINTSEIYTTTFKPTPADVGALALTGGVVTGTTTFQGNLGLSSGRLFVEGVNVIGASALVTRFGDADLLRELNLNAKDGLVFAQQSGGVRRRMYHEGFKPTAADVNAVAKTGDAMSGVLDMTHKVNQFRGPTAGATDLNTMHSSAGGRWAYVSNVTPGGAINMFPASNNANGLLTFNTHQGEYGRQFGFSSNGAVYTRYKDGVNWSTWRKMYDEANKPTLSELNATPSYEVIVSNGGGAKWVCIGRMARTDNNVSILLSGTGDFGGRARDNITIAMASRGNVVQVDANRFKRQNSYGEDVKLYTKDTGSAFELWVRVSSYQHSVRYILLSGNGWVDMRSGQTTTQPSGLVEVTINDIFTTAFRPDLGHINAGTFGHDFKVAAGKKIILPTTDYATGTVIETLPAGDGFGSNFFVVSGGNTVIGAGEGGNNLRNLTTGEVLHLVADEQVRIYSGAQTWGNRKLTLIGGDGNMTVNDGQNTSKVFLGGSTAYVARSGAGTYITNLEANGKVYIEGKANPVARVNGADYTIYHTGYQPSELRGSNYNSPGYTKPNEFGAGKFRYQMLRDQATWDNLWCDALWVSSYTGNDVKVSNVIVMTKGGSPKIGFRQQNYDATEWGKMHEIYHTSNKPTAADVGAFPTGGGTITGKVRINFGQATDPGLLVGSTSHKATINTSSNAGEALFGASKDGNVVTAYLRIGHTPTSFTVSHDASTQYKIYHEGNKPTAANVGALPIGGGSLTGVLHLKDGLKSALRVQNGSSVRFADGGNAWMHLIAEGSALMVRSGDDASQKNLFSVSSSGAVNSRVKPLSMNEGCYNGETEGGVWRRGQGVYHAKVSHQGSSWAPMFSGFFHDTQGWAGYYSLGHLSLPSTASPGQFCLHYMDDNGNNGKNWSFNGSNGDFASPGNVIAYSDARVKDNIKVIENALDKIDQIRGVTYDRTDLPGVTRHMGVIAQEVEKVAPEVVSTEHRGDIEDFKAVAYGNLAALLIEGIKELRGELKDIKAHLGM